MARITSVTPAAFRACIYSSRSSGGGGPRDGGLPLLLLPRHESLLPAAPRTSIWWQIMGLLQKSTSGLGTVSVSGRRRVPVQTWIRGSAVTAVQRPCCCPRLSPQHLTIATDKNQGLHPAAIVLLLGRGWTEGGPHREEVGVAGSERGPEQGRTG